MFPKPTYKTGGTNLRKSKPSKNDKAMVSGVSSILRKIKDKKNRKEVAGDMVKQFNREGVNYNKEKFLKNSRSYQLGGPKPTFADSSMLRENALAKINFYKNNPDYTRGETSTTDFTDPNVRKKLVNTPVSLKDQKVNKNLIDMLVFNYRGSTGKPMSVEDRSKFEKELGVKKFGKVAGTNLTSFGDIGRGKPNTFYNPLSPPIYLHPNISPQGSERYNSDLLGDVSEVPRYEPLAISPWNVLTEAEKKERIEKYGVSGTPYTSKKDYLEKTKKPTNTSQMQRYNYMSTDDKKRAVKKYGDPSKVPFQGVDINQLRREVRTFQAGGTRGPIYVSDPRDSRLRRYNDSLNLYKGYVMQDYLMGPKNERISPGTRISWTPAELRKDRTKKWDPVLKRKVADDFQNQEDMFASGFVDENNKKLVRYYKSLGFTDDNIMYHTSADLVHPTIRAIGTYMDGSALSPVYKKPVQPVKYADPKVVEKQKILKDAGLYTGELDGIWGSGSEKAWKEYTERKKATSSTTPSTSSTSRTTSTTPRFSIKGIIADQYVPDTKNPNSTDYRYRVETDKGFDVIQGKKAFDEWKEKNASEYQPYYKKSTNAPIDYNKGRVNEYLEKPTLSYKKGGQHGGLDRWFAEKWVDVKSGKPCGRQEGENRAYPACRPSKRVSSKTPKTSSELSSKEKARFKATKTSSQRIPYNHKRK